MDPAERYRAALRHKGIKVEQHAEVQVLNQRDAQDLGDTAFVTVQVEVLPSDVRMAEAGKPFIIGVMPAMGRTEQ